MNEPLSRLKARKRAQQLAKDARALADFAKGRNLPKSQVELDALNAVLEENLDKANQRIAALRVENRQKRSKLLCKKHELEGRVSRLRAARARSTDQAEQQRFTTRINDLLGMVLKIEDSLS